MAALQPHLCELVALSASSPFWRGEPTGFSSSRRLIFSAFPRSGPPPDFASYAEYAQVVRRLIECGCIEDYTRIWWDVRPHPHFGTIEVRVMDALPRVDDAISLAAYVQALAARLLDADRAGEASTLLHPALSHENKWRAARYGLGATVIDPAGDGAVPIARLIERTLEEIAPHARELGCDGHLDGVRRILREGNGADRQLTVYARTADVRDVTRDLVGVTQRA
jgi:carboxylate-amine ligase